MNFIGIGPGELILILLIALIVFGPRRLPEIGRALGKAIAEFRRMSQELTAEMGRELKAESPQKAEETEGESGDDASTRNDKEEDTLFGKKRADASEELAG